jgi:hypothetical protein
LQGYKSLTKQRWPIQQIPALDTLRIWVKYITQITQCCKNGIIKQRLGKWVSDPNESIQIQYWIHYTQDYLINHPPTGNKWYLHKRTSDKYSKISFYNIGKEYTQKIDFKEFYLIDLCEQNNLFTIDPRDIISYDNSKVHQHIDIEKYDDLWDYIINYATDSQHLLKGIDIIDESPLLQNYATEIVMCSDGGVNENIAGFGSVVSVNGVIIMTNKRKLPEIVNSYTSHRSEAMGMLGSFLILEALSNFRIGNNMSASVIEATIICDNKSVVDTVNKFRCQGTCLKDFYSPDADILQEITKIRENLANLNVTTKITHVKGHQDRTSNVLSDHAILNIEADKLATKSLKMRKPKLTTTTLANASLIINNLLVAGDHKRILRKNYLSIDLRAHLEKSNSWHKNEIDNIWWKVYEMAFNDICKTHHKFIQKFVHNRLPCNYQQNKFYPYKNLICRACNIEVETQQHILTCVACPEQTKIRKKYLLELSVLLDNQRTNAATTTILLQNVKCNLNNSICESIQSMVPDATKTLLLASKQQADIGWDHWWKGRLSQEWAALVNYDISTVKSGIRFNSSEKWAKDIIKLNWDFVYQMWVERNRIEHDMNGDPELRKKEKLIEIIQGEYNLLNLDIYQVDEMTSEQLQSLPIDNLTMIETNIKNAKLSKRKRNEQMDK